MKYCYDYPRPAVTVDAAIFAPYKNDIYVLLVERKYDPYSGFFALPGGFVEENETLEMAVERELKEETSLTLSGLKQFKAYSTPNRDPRGRTISVVFTLQLDSLPEAFAGDDAASLKWFSVKQLPKLAFDHNVILDEILKNLFEKNPND